MRGEGRTEVALGRAPRRGPRPPPPGPRPPTRSRGHSPGAPRPCPARRSRRRPRGPQLAPRPLAPPAAPSAQRPRQALPGIERGRPRAAAGAAGTCSSPHPPRPSPSLPPPPASLCPDPASPPRALPAPCPPSPRAALSCARLALCPSLCPAYFSLCPCRSLPGSVSIPFSVSLSLCLYFHPFASVPVTFSASVARALSFFLCFYLLLMSLTLSLFQKHHFVSPTLAMHISLGKALRSPAIYTLLYLCLMD